MKVNVNMQARSGINTSSKKLLIAEAKLTITWFSTSRHLVLENLISSY